MHLKALKTTTYTISFLLLWLFTSTNSALAQEKSSFNIGLAVAISNTPEESQLEKANQATDFFMDWGEARFGINSNTAKKNLSLYDNTWNTFLSTQTYYGAWRPALGDSKDEGAYALIGLGYFISDLDLGNSTATESSQAFGLVSGVGTNAKLGEISFGLQANYLTAEGKFHDITVALGGIQLMFTMHLEI
ncbi:MAG: hypothetical protein QNL04_01830 [SAR324 cluster bacterium]|nr:hypothetical protein [SAR324 cluster bacterium]